MTRRRFQLSDAMNTGIFMRMSTRFEEGKVRGCIEAVGPKFVMVSLISEGMWFDGFECFRITDIIRAEPDPYATFAEAALKKRRQKRPKKPRVDLANIKTLLLSAARDFPLVTINREEIDPDVCWIGRVLDVNGGRVSLLEIGPDAKWDHKPNEYSLKEITRVGFGADYEDALYSVGGDPSRA